MALPRKIEHGRGVSYEITYRVEAAWSASGSRRRSSAEQALAKAQVSAMEGTYVFRGEARTTVAEYAPQWLASLRVEATTLLTYESYLRRHVVERLSNRAMSSLRRSTSTRSSARCWPRGWHRARSGRSMRCSR